MNNERGDTRPTSTVKFLLVILLLTGIACKTNVEPQATQTPPQSTPAYAIPLEDEPPLRLDDYSVTGTEQADGPIADNSRCFVCHLSYVEEDLALTHALQEIGCAQCHGESDAHIADEPWTSGGTGTAPDIIVLPHQVNEFCMDCHARDTLSMPDHNILETNKADASRCTDCHGEHRLTNRVTQWK
jgi:hypothetical protein